VTESTTTSPPLSLKGRAWSVRSGDPAAARALEAAGLNPFAPRIMSGRNLGGTPPDKFLNPKLRDLMPDPSRFKDMDKGVAHLCDRIEAGDRIGVWSDYDADGATSAAVLIRFLRMLGVDEVPLRIPDRITEGYGPNTAGLIGMLEDGCTTVCILDAGIVAFEPLAAAKEAGLNVIVIDHHAAEPEVPEAVAVINANRQDEEPGYGHLCAAGMTFIFCVAVTRELRRRGRFDGADGRPSTPPDLMTLLDLVAIGTVADVVPLTGLNRAFVARGLPYLSERRNPGAAALLELGDVKSPKPVLAQHCGWVLGPRINAGGRIADSTLGARCLIADDPEEAARLAAELHRCNEERRALEAAATEQALTQADGYEPGVTRRSLIAIVEGHEGVVGISAARVREAVDAPTIVLTEDHEGNLKGSARSVPGFDIGHAIIAARKAGLIMKGGGHGMAGGLTLTREQLVPFQAFLDEEVRKSPYFQDGVSSEADLEARLSDLSVRDVDALDPLEPFGTANPEPVIIVKGAELREIIVLKEKHFKLILGDGGATAPGLLWNVVGTPLADQISALTGAAVDVLGKIEINDYRGNRTLQVKVEDIRPAVGLLT
jgi:single-stranded-DNA-specific exonuclease